jgi:hypothetical protein
MVLRQLATVGARWFALPGPGLLSTLARASCLLSVCAFLAQPLAAQNTDNSSASAREAAEVARLKQLLNKYYDEEQAAREELPRKAEIARRKRAQEEAENLTPVVFSPNKVQLSGAEGSAALSQITQRLADPSLPESRRDVGPVCSIKTRLFGTLISSENRSLKPVGKYHYVARVRLQPGDTTLYISSNRWELQLPQDTSATEYMVTYYQPGGGRTELHVFPIDELLANKNHHIPAWLPEELELKPRAG